MGRDTYRFQALDKQREARKRMNPIWRGVGCVVIGGFALASYAFAGWFLRENAVNNWIYIPGAAYNPARWPFLGGGLLIRLVVALLFTMFAYGIMSVIYAAAFPIKPGETDAPPPRRVRSRRKR